MSQDGLDPQAVEFDSDAHLLKHGYYLFETVLSIDDINSDLKTLIKSIKGFLQTFKSYCTLTEFGVEFVCLAKQENLLLLLLLSAGSDNFRKSQFL